MTSNTKPVRLPHYFTLKNAEGNYLTLSAVLNYLPFNFFSSKERTRLSTYEALYNSKDNSDSTVMIRAPNGRYWRRFYDNSSPGTIPSAHEEPKDPSDKTYHFQIVEAPDAKNKIVIKSTIDGLDVFPAAEVQNAESLALNFPTFLMLKANNGKFLSASSGDKSLRCNMDSRELEGAFQATPLVDGNFIFQSVTSKLFWRRDTDNDDWIIADTKKEAALEDRFCHFNASRVSKNMITIRCVGYDSGLFVLRSDNENKLKAVSSSVDNAATHFTVYDGTSNKHIFNVKYLLGLAEVTDIRPLVVGQGSVVNNGGQNADLQVQVSFTESVSTSNRWMTSQTVGLETSLTVSAGIPEIASVEATVTVGVEKTTETELGKEMTNLLTFQSGYLIKDVPPGGEAKVAVECTRGKCRVPFTYSTKATRLDGIDTKVEDEIGGVYEGVSIFNVRGVISGSAPSKPAATSKPATGSGGLVGSVVSGTGTVVSGVTKGTEKVVGGVVGSLFG
ncbi:uncharacterized protein LOC112349858 [Selaginella moellendorffii]|uniref:uncharacterized protein LOC112349858 n=1 Tax=Selaginella moellendorffii TaxID=88036 RepID=UPI000D1C6D4F|nr:uncharacterized protein LOC112349858 [Selaginella moellendorffii]|eukprot:XP_024540783.1 uncharacterized protein LOC112349858 [Selaginella moellendorffii]